MAQGGSLGKYWSERRGAFIYEIRYRNAEGKSRRKSLRVTDKKLAEMRLAEWLAAEGRLSRPVDMPPAEALRRYLASVELAHPGTRTRAFYERFLRPFFEKHEGLPLDRWTRPMLEAYLSEKPNWSPRTKQMLVTSCKTFINWAQDCLLLPEGRTFVGRLRIPQAKRDDHATLTREHVLAMMAEARAKPRTAYLELPIALAAFAGLSESDWAALTWDSVDLKKGVIDGRRAKTGGRFVVAITPVLDEALRRFRATSGPVCRDLPKTDGAPRQALRSVQKRVGVPIAPRGQNSWKRLRHSFLTWLADAGVPAHERRLAGGHSPGSPMAERYTHPDDERTLAAVRRALG